MKHKKTEKMPQKTLDTIANPNSFPQILKYFGKFCRIADPPTNQDPTLQKNIGNFEGKTLLSIWLVCLILFQANGWVEVSPGGTAPTARYFHAAGFDSTNSILWVFGGYDDTGPLLSVVQHAYNTYWKNVREIWFGKAASFKKWGTGRKNDLHYYDVTVLLVVSGW